ncbi:MAG TPA: hypothetical protein VFO11_10250 [Candidatus Polarisedimenticolaceae bacterium]|nr:hypothetical protein [Candidatus Polarisedimenticolaceae bacterium]
MKTVPLLLVTLLVTASHLPAKVTARQGPLSPWDHGKEGAPAGVSFQSPMVLDVPLPGLASARDGEPFWVEDLSGYDCRGVSIRQLSLTPVLRKDGRVRLDPMFVFHVEPGADTRASVRLELLDGEEVVGGWWLRDFSTEEGHSRAAKITSAILKEETYRALQRGRPLLRLTLETHRGTR